MAPLQNGLLCLGRCRLNRFRGEDESKFVKRGSKVEKETVPRHVVLPLLSTHKTRYYPERDRLEIRRAPHDESNNITPTKEREKNRDSGTHTDDIFFKVEYKNSTAWIISLVYRS